MTSLQLIIVVMYWLLNARGWAQECGKDSTGKRKGDAVGKSGRMQGRMGQGMMGQGIKWHKKERG